MPSLPKPPQPQWEIPGLWGGEGEEHGSAIPLLRLQIGRYKVVQAVGVLISCLPNGAHAAPGNPRPTEGEDADMGPERDTMVLIGMLGFGGRSGRTMCCPATAYHHTTRDTGVAKASKCCGWGRNPAQPLGFRSRARALWDQASMCNTTGSGPGWTPCKQR